jgi:hypothetical protein
MNNIFVIAGVIAVVFLIMKFIEMRFIEKENKPLKLLIRDALVVYISVIIGYFILEQLKPVMTGGDVIENATQVFTDNPGF